MTVRRTGITTVVTALLLAALVAVIGSAQAAPSSKFYDATVHVKNGTTVTATAATLTLTLRNDAKSKQTLGSANFTPPAGVAPATPSATDRTGWTAGLQGNVVTFRSTNALAPGESVSADVAVTIGTCTDATWTSQVKQSNDFSGTGNDFAINNALSNPRPLGKFTIDRIETQVGDQLVPQIYVNQPKAVQVHAFDLCGVADSSYGTTVPGNFGDAATLAAATDTPARLVGSGLPKAIAWPAGTASMTPVVVETVDMVVATDAVSGINATSNDFDVVETICTADTTCHWDNGNNKIHVDAPSPPEGASLGIGFSDEPNFSCDSGTTPLGSTLIYVNPRDYPTGGTQSVTFTYDKTIPGTSGPVSNFDVCISKDNGVIWSDPILDCSTDPPAISEAPCVEDRGRSSGNLVITVFFDPHGDPLGGIT